MHWTNPPVSHQGSLLPGEPHLKFVVKHHWSQTLHDDFRLEVGGVLVSWMMFGHPSLDTRCPKELITRPDHDPRYWLSERRIPKGRIGAGPLLVWDYGHYRPLRDPENDHSKSALRALNNGELDFELFGRRLQGRFRISYIARDRWSLTKLPDRHASLYTVWDSRSILTGRTLAEI